jgi:type II secretory pathway component PulJ
MRARRGAVLLEVIAAVSIFAFAATGSLSLISQLADTEHQARQREKTVVDQDRLLAAYSLLSRDDLDRRLGQRVVGPYQVEVQRPESLLYRIAIGDSSGPELMTLVYRPGTR